MGYEPLSLPFGAGMDSKSDPKMLEGPKVVLLQDGIFTNIKKITKRNGYDELTNALVGGGTWSSPTMSASYKNELLIAATTSLGQRLLGYSPTLDAWQDKGKYLSIGVSKTIVGDPLGANLTEADPSGGYQNTQLGTFNLNSVVLGNIAVYAYEAKYSPDTTANVISITVIDLSTGLHLADNLQAVAAGTAGKLVIVDKTVIALLYVGSTGGTNFLDGVTITITQAGGVVIGSPVAIGACVADTGGSAPYKYCYDVVGTSTGATVAVASTGNVVLYNLSSALATLATATITSSGTILPIHISQDPTIRHFFVYWVSAGTALNFAVYTSALSLVEATTNIDTVANCSQICAFSTSQDHQNVYYSQFLYPTSQIGVINCGIKQTTVTSLGVVGSITAFVQNADIYSKPIEVSGVWYIACYTLSSFNSIGFLIDVTDGKPVAKFLPGQAEGIYSNVGDTTGNTDQTALILSFRYPGFINAPQVLSSTQIQLACGYISTLSTVEISSATNQTAYQATETTGVTLGACAITFDFDNIDAYQSIIQQETLVLNGGIVYQYDSSAVCELGFSADPDGITVVTATSAGNIGAGTFIYYVVYSWTDSLGNLSQSAPSLAATVVFTTGTTNKVTIGFRETGPSQRPNGQIVASLYRTIADGQIAYLVGQAGSSPTGTIGSIVDTFADATIEVLSQLYTQGGAILENIAPPAALIMWTNINRLWVVPSETPETNIEYCKTASTGTGISFSAGQLELVIDSSYGAITGASKMDEKTVILKQNGLGYFVGDGATDAGVNSTITSFQFIPSDTGCSNSKSVLLFPHGILFRSSNNKGIYLVSRGLEINYFGTDVNAYNNQDIQSAILVPNKNQIRFLTSSGYSLHYDYVFNMWSIFTNHTGLSACTFQGAYVYVRTDGTVYQEDLTGQFLDNTTPFAPLVVMSWLKAQSTQGFERVRRTMMLGDLQTANGGHGIQISAAYDFNPNFGMPVPYIFTQTDAANGFYQYRERLARQKCDSLQLKIQEIVTGAAAEYIDFNDLGIEILPKGGLNKLPGSQSVG